MQSQAHAPRRGALLDSAQRVLYTCADVLATRSSSRLEVVPRLAQQPERVRRRRYRPHRRSGRGSGLTGSSGRERLVVASLVVGRHDGRREVVKRYRLIAAVGAVAMFTAVLGGSSAYGGSSGAARGSPIKLGVLTPLTGHFAPWGIQVRAGAALAVNEINRSGGVKGRGQGRLLNLAVADDQSTNTNAAIDGFRRLTAAGGRRLGRGHHRQPDRAGDLAARRGGEDPAVPRQVGEQRDPDAVESLHVPHLPARCCHGRPVGRAARAAS